MDGGGEMGALTRQYDWAATPLGPPERWPQSLRTTLSIILHSRFPMFLFWGEQHLCFYNDAYRPSLGKDGKHPQALGKPGADVWPEVWPIIKPMIDQVLTGGEATWSEDQLIPIYRNGQLEDVYWTYSYSPVSDESGKPMGVFVTCTETTQKVNILNRLQLSEQRFQNLVREASVGIVVLTGDDMVVSIVNNAYARLINRSAGDLAGKPLFSIVPETEADFRPILDQVRHTGEPVYLYGRPYFVYADDRKKEGFLNLVYQPYREQDGNVSGVMVLCQDVTEQVATRQKLAESEAKFRSLIEEAPVATCLFVGPSMRIDIANDTMLGYWGKSRAVLGQPLNEALPELTEQPFPQILAEIYSSGRIHSEKGARADLEVNGVLSTYYFDYTYKPLRNAAGAVYAILNMAVDATDRVVAQQQIEETQQQVLTSFEQSPVAIAIISEPDLTFRMVNPFYAQLVGRHPEQLIDKPLLAALPEIEGQGFDQLLRQVMATGVPYVAPETEVSVMRHNQLETIYVDLNYQPRRKTDGSITGVLVIATDVTGQVKTRQAIEASEARYRKLSEELDQQVRQRTNELEITNRALSATNNEFTAANRALEEANYDLTRSNQNLEQFAYIASHDLQEPLRKIQAFGDILKSHYGTALGAGVDHLDRMQAAASRMSQLIHDLLAFSRISTSQAIAIPVALDEVIGQGIENLSVAIDEASAQIRVEALPTVMGDRLQLGQLFQNLLSNAIKFSRRDENGDSISPQVIVKSTQIPASDLPLSLKPTRHTESYHCIAVTDNGIGFDEKYASRIFQVFQRLHARNEYAGTGVGLAICEKVAANHGGGIVAHSRPGAGATFSVYLPA
ncbi:PAS domain-containing protein [Fibrella sp. HMF5335]|uniref:histidine kinase n=2 Tax=Fibrella rubiginis TaxID=2817060 RepID=A0A939K0Z6_9BACT|nr:PAS domain-containing protein [Fibrella rubiginis]